MEIKYLKEFAHLAQTCNYQETAHELYISQSTLSKHIMSIETELGVSLFDRTTRSVKLSKLGEILLPFATQIARLQNEYSLALRDANENREDSIVVGAIPALAEYNITEALIRFKKSGIKCQLHITQCGTPELKEMLRAGKCDLAFIREVTIEDDDFTRIPFATDNLVAVFPKGHLFAGKDTITIAELQNEEFLLLNESTMLYRMVVEVAQKCGYDPKIAFTDHKIENLMDWVLKGMGVAFLMKRLAEHHAVKNTVMVDVKPQIITQISLCYRKNAQLTDSAKLFIECARSV